MWALLWLIARRSLTGLGPRLWWMTLVMRCIVAGLIAFALADPQWRKEVKDLSVVAVMDVSRSMPTGTSDAFKTWLGKAAESSETGDRIGIVSAAESALAHALPNERVPARKVAADLDPSAWPVGERDGTDLGAAVRLAMAVKPEDTAGRILVVSDGNETAGSLLTAAKAAKAAGLVIDVLPVPYNVEREVIFDTLAAPTNARVGQTTTLRMVLTSTRATRGRLSLLMGGDPIDISPDESGPSLSVALDAGRNVVSVPLTIASDGPQSFEAVFEPEVPSQDTLQGNNRARAVTFVSGEGRVLLLAEDPSAAEDLARALAESKIKVEVLGSAACPGTLVEMQRYDAIILFDTPASSFTMEKQKALAAFVHDAGGGLVMVGGSNSFGAGGWLNTPVAEALPVKLDPPQKRQIVRGALALVMHSCEMPQGNYWGQQTAQAAARALSRLDLVGVIEFSWTGGNGDGTRWAYPMAEVGDGSGVSKAIAGLNFGDAPDFQSLMQQSFDALVAAKAGQKHCIIISDGDPSPPSNTLIRQFIAEKITVSTVLVFPHPGDFGGLQNMQNIAKATGGQFYAVTTVNQLGMLPQIFTKEAQIVRRSLIWEGDPITPKLINPAAETVRGMGANLPAITGYVVTAEREGLAMTTIAAGEGDPIAAQMQHGLGRSVAFTSDATGRWSRAWVEWPKFRAFWDQHMRWVMKPGGSANVSVVTETDGDQTKVIVTALDAKGENLNFATFRGRLVGPELASGDVELRQTGPGRYEGRFDSGGNGTYLLNLRYDVAGEGGRAESGTVQAAIVRPYADELRSLEHNAGLLRQAAELTGGRVLNGDDPAQTPLFSRDELSMPAAERSIWLAVALAGLALLVVDVGLRRVRLDARAVIAGLRKRLAAQGKARPEQELTALQGARERARGTMAGRGAGVQAPSAQQMQDLSAVKFEASPDFKGAGPVSAAGSASTPTTAPIAKPKEKASQDKPEETGLSRLRAAKQRARDTMNPEDPPPGS